MRLNREIRDRIDDPEGKRRYVRGLFAGIAGRYDVTNDVMSLGLHRSWKRRALKRAGLEPGMRVLDLAAGTGDLAGGALAAVGEGHVVAADLTPAMMRVGRARTDTSGIAWVAADAAALPFPDGHFDRVLIGYGLRNFADLEACLFEIRRCLRPGGRLVTLDFGHPRAGPLRRLYMGYLEVSMRAVGWVLHGDAASYVYIQESLRKYPGQRGVREAMERTGYVDCGFEELLFGAMAINVGTRPERR